MATFKGDVTCVAAHDLDDAATVVALGGVAQLIDHLERGVHRRIITDGVVGAGNIVVDGAGQADHGCRGVPAHGRRGKSRRRR